MRSAAVEAEDEFEEIGFQVFPAQPMIDTAARGGRGIAWALVGFDRARGPSATRPGWWASPLAHGGGRPPDLWQGEGVNK